MVWSDRRRRVMRFVLLLVASWCVMTMTHETGHIVCGWAGGGTLQEAEIAPWSLPHSHFDPDPLPLLTLWGGPLLGVLVPLMAAVLVRRGGMWFVAFFCLLANGCYLASSWVTGEQYLDTPKLLHHGASRVAIAVYCLVTIGIGYVGFRHQCIQALSVPKLRPATAGALPDRTAG
jgi:hypothetical protein